MLPSEVWVSNVRVKELTSINNQAYIFQNNNYLWYHDKDILHVINMLSRAHLIFLQTSETTQSSIQGPFFTTSTDSSNIKSTRQLFL
jgi:hypothetical protein